MKFYKIIYYIELKARLPGLCREKGIKPKNCAERGIRVQAVGREEWNLWESLLKYGRCPPSLS